ncbi:UBA/TS-N domain-containing protein [Besnoitia besnoiti]|uniref:UBA/TS-N domain-containing protein n=1 Tax=Besnoitia besnoiti TaxID=94643 RepID=A0A2A9MEU1_BESBE|nr:UBA/TS-N domain-containing protein [Besnoitia besnoiti]PFH34147.1 UBA/TS-N domain-containing protein [Besnoitia besnoiti]
MAASNAGSQEVPPLAQQDKDRRWSVQLRVYDLSRGMARQMSPMLLGRQIDGIWHTGVVVYGIEYFYGGGVCCLPPEQVERDYQMSPTRLVNMGFTTIDRATFDAYVQQISPRFTEATYDLLHWNCNHFTQELTQFLLQKPIPDYIRFQVDEVAQTPMGSMLLPMLQRQQQQMQRVASSMGQRTLWTQGGAGVAPPPAQPPRASVPWPDSSSPLGAVLRGVCTSEELVRSSKKVFLLTLLTVVKNLLKPERDPKFLRLRKSNEVIQTKLLRIPGGQRALELIGFELQREDNKAPADTAAAAASGGDAEEFVFTLFRGAEAESRVLEKLNQQAGEIQAFIEALDGAAPPTAPAAAPPSPPPAQTHEDKFKFQLQQLENMGFVEKQKNIEALEAVNGNLNAAIDRLLG